MTTTRTRAYREWTVLLTISENGHSYREDLHAHLASRARETWTDIIEKQDTAQFLTTQRKDFMKAKLDMLSPMTGLDYNLTSTRQRRGVLDFVGTGLNWAFGTATEAQVTRLQDAVHAAQTSQHAIVHNIQELVTVVNRTRVEQRNAQLKLKTLADNYDAFVVAEGRRWGRHEENNRVIILEEYVDSLLWMNNAITNEDELVNRLHLALRYDRLTEDLCPISLLEEIVQLASEHNLRPLPVEWYFENTLITPVMRRDGIMTFRMVIPFTDHRVYQRFNIATYEVPMDDNGTRAKVIVQADIAMETANGLWFVPALCQGHRPQLCRAGPRWRDAFPCERGVLTGHEPDRRMC